MDSDLSFRRVAIVGMGLIGGSLARALRAAHPRIELRGFSHNDEDALAARAAVGVEPASSLRDAAAGAELVVYATPVEATIELLGTHAKFLADDVVITDVGSLKLPVLRRASALGIERRMVGGHPMAGGHESGFAASRPDLFEGERIWLVHGDSGQETAGKRVARLWRSVGARPGWIDADAHDALVALASQLPQIASSLLAASISEGGLDPDELGPGGHDSTRLAASPPDLWAPLLDLNRERLMQPVRRFREALERIERALERGDREEIRRVLELGRRWRGADT